MKVFNSSTTAVAAPAISGVAVLSELAVTILTEPSSVEKQTAGNRLGVNLVRRFFQALMDDSAFRDACPRHNVQLAHTPGGLIVY
jgi:hypothetical protein